MRPVAALLKGYVAPELAARGYALKKRALVRVAEDGGSAAVVAFQFLGYTQEGYDRVMIHPKLLTEPLLNFTDAGSLRSGNVDYALAGGLVTSFVWPPQTWANPRLPYVPGAGSPEWVLPHDVSKGAVEACGEDVVKVLLKNHLPQLERGLRRWNLLDEFLCRREEMESDFAGPWYYNAIWIALDGAPEAIVEDLLDKTRSGFSRSAFWGWLENWRSEANLPADSGRANEGS